MTLRKLIVLLFLPVFLGNTVSASADTRQTMHLVYAALTELLPLALNADGFEDEPTRQRMADSLAILERSAEELEVHASDMEFSSLARSFRSNVVLMKNTMRFDRIYEFNYLALDLTQTCVSCHSRLQSSRVEDFSGHLTDSLESELVSPVDFAQLQIATRQFDGALETLSEIILHPEVEPVDLELQGVLFDYLLVAVTSDEYTDRATEVLDKFMARTDTPYYMKSLATGWKQHLLALAERTRGGVDLELGRALFNEALNISPMPSSQERLVYDLVTSRVLREVLESDVSLADQAVAEIYWMLAAISIRSVNPRPGVPHTEILLDAAIRNAPGTDLAKRAYAVLEEFNRISFAGIPVAELPEPVLNLEELAGLAGIR